MPVLSDPIREAQIEIQIRLRREFEAIRNNLMDCTFNRCREREHVSPFGLVFAVYQVHKNVESDRPLERLIHDLSFFGKASLGLTSPICSTASTEEFNYVRRCTNRAPKGIHYKRIPTVMGVTAYRERHDQLLRELRDRFANLHTDEPTVNDQDDDDLSTPD